MKFTTQLTIGPPLGLIEIGNQIVAEKVNVLLSDYKILNQNVKFFHWNFIGPDFFDLRQSLKDLSEKLSQEIERLGDGMVMAGLEPFHTYSEYLQSSDLKEVAEIISDEESIRKVVIGLQKLIGAIRKSATEAEGVNDIIPEELLSHLALELENELWVFTMFAKY